MAQPDFDTDPGVKMPNFKKKLEKKTHTCTHSNPNPNSFKHEKGNHCSSSELPAAHGTDDSLYWPPLITPF